MDGIRLIDYRTNYHMATAISTFLNAMGGKSDKGKPLPKHKMYAPEDFLAPFANPYHRTLPRQAARDILEHVNKDYFPDWALKLLPTESELKQAASN